MESSYPQTGPTLCKTCPGRALFGSELAINKENSWTIHPGGAISARFTDPAGTRVEVTYPSRELAVQSGTAGVDCEGARRRGKCAVGLVFKKMK